MGNRRVFLVPDDAMVVRASELEEMLIKRNQKEIAAVLGISASTLCRFMASNGYARRWSRSGDGVASTDELTRTS